jgi:hypothetical protein
MSDFSAHRLRSERKPRHHHTSHLKLHGPLSKVVPAMVLRGGESMRVGLIAIAGSLSLTSWLAAMSQSPRDIVNQAVQTELSASRNDHTRWIYYDIDRKPEEIVHQWTAETGSGSIHRVLIEKGKRTTEADQRNAMDRFIGDPSAQAKQRKAGQHDDKQSEDMLLLLPDAFHWTIAGTKGDLTVLHFTPDDQFKPPTWEARVFAAMEGDMLVSKTGHRIVSLKGRLIHDVKFCGGICGNLNSGGTFDVERRQTGPSVWQITETHVHIHGHALLFKNISEEEDEVKTQFQQLPGDVSLQQAEAELLKKNGEPNGRETAHATTASSRSTPPS